MKKKKLIIFHPYSNLGGADRNLYRLINNLDLKKFSITFISLERSVLNKELDKKINFINLKASRSLYVIFELRKILKYYIKDKHIYEKIILISNQNFANIISFFSSFNLINIKKIFIERNHLDELNYYDGFFKFLKKQIIKVLMKITYKKADKVIAICNELSKDLSYHINRSVQTIHSPSYDKSIFKLQHKKIKFKFRKNNIYLINISRFSEYKGQIDILKATNLLFHKYKNLKLILIGYGEYKKKLIKFIKNNNLEKNVTIIDNCSNPYPYLRKSSLFIFASNYEGFPNVLNEALMLNVPVISSNCKSGPREILLNGKGGDLFPKKNYYKLRTMIENFILNPIKLQNKLKLARKHLWKLSVKRHIKLYNKLLSKV
jgi:glycosyltransferase involved in cell wall biosynthesis